MKLTAIFDNFNEVIVRAEREQPGYAGLIEMFLEKEIHHRNQKDMERRKKRAQLPLSYDLDRYDFSLNNGLRKNSLTNSES